MQVKNIGEQWEDSDYLSDLDQEILDYIFEKYKSYADNPQRLIDITHDYSAWKNNESVLSETRKRKRMNMEDVFNNDGDLVVNDKDIRMAQEMYGTF